MDIITGEDLMEDARVLCTPIIWINFQVCPVDRLAILGDSISVPRDRQLSRSQPWTYDIITRMSAAEKPELWQRPVLLRSLVLIAALFSIGWLLNTPGGLLGKADALGYAVCHRIEIRSFQIGGRPLSLCARCTGMYLGAVLGLIYQSLRGRRKAGYPPTKVIFGLVALGFAFGVDGLNSFSNLLPGIPSLYTTNNTLRIFTGTGFGLVMAAALFPAFNQSVWKGLDMRPAIPDLRTLGLLVILGVLTALMVLSGNPLILYPLSLISAFGVLLLLTMIYTVMAITVFRSENRFLKLGQIWTPLLLGFSIALLQIAASDYFRYWLTGTWDGFHIP